MSTFIDLCRDVRRETSTAGETISSVLNNAGETARIVNWVKQAHEDIQNEYTDWKFLRKKSTFTTNANTNIIQPPADLNIWDMERMFTDKGHEIDMVDYDDVEGMMDITVKGKPSMFIVLPDNTLQAYPWPDAAYTYQFDYYRTPAIMTVDTDKPLFPAHFHRAILGRALIYYGNHESAPEVKQQGTEIYNYVMDKLEKHQLGNKQQFYSRGNVDNGLVVVAE